MTPIPNYWKAPENVVLPDFIIGGAMKSGTTTLHTILAHHPKIFMPKGELNFFDMDDILQHSDFNFYNKSKDTWISQDLGENPDKLWNWYNEKFKEGAGKLIGEDSTAYLPSANAAKRIALQSKDIKMIFILRHPTNRAFSQYHHMLRTGRVTDTFENVIRFNPVKVLERSLYKKQLDSFYSEIGAERIKVILFEDLISDTQKTIKGVCEFLGLDFGEFHADALKAHSNKTKFPFSYRLQRLKNLIFRKVSNLNYIGLLPNSPVENKKNRALWYKILNKANRTIVPLVGRKSPNINDGTKNFLDRYFYNELDGIDELVGDEVMTKWFGQAKNV